MKIAIKTLALLLSIMLLASCGSASSGSSSAPSSSPASVSGGTASGADASSATESWPKAGSTLTLVVPFDVGGSADRQARAMAPYLSEYLGATVVIENRNGASGAVGVKTHLDSDPDDGSYIVYNSHPQFDATIVRDAGYKYDDLDIIGVAHSSPMALYVRADSPYNSVEDLVTALKNGEDLIGAATPGSYADILARYFGEAIGIDYRIIPYDSGSEFRAALLSGDVQIQFSDVEGAISNLGDQIKFLAVVQNEPYEALKDVPLFNDVMGTDFPASANMRFVHVKSSFKAQYPERFDKWVEAFAYALEQPEMIEWAKSQSMNMEWMGPEKATEMLKASNAVINEYSYMFE